MGIVKKIIRFLIILIALGVIIYFSGPKVVLHNMDKTLPTVTRDLKKLESEILLKENQNKSIKADNAARIVWYDSVPKKTEYSMVYLHGWSASQKEGDPIHRETAKRYGCNLFLPRLAGHGLKEEEPMLKLTADQLIDSAKEAIAVAKQIGDKVIIMGTSTGGTLALHLAGDDKDIAALLLYSPNIELFDSKAKLLTKPWGLAIARWVKGSNYHEFDRDNELKNKYWTTRYRIEALTHLQALIDNTMTPDTFKDVRQPTFLGYFYKNDSIQDNVVSIPAMKEMFNKLGTPGPEKRKVAFANVGDHVMTSHVTSKDLESVRKETNSFIENVLNLQPK